MKENSIGIWIYMKKKIHINLVKLQPVEKVQRVEGGKISLETVTEHTHTYVFE